MCTDIELAEVLANKLEYCDLVGDVSYTMEDFYREQGITKLPPTCMSFLIMEKAKKILEERKRGIEDDKGEARPYTQI